MDAIHVKHGTALLERENVRGDRGMIFLIGMAAAGALMVVATLSFADSPAKTGPVQVQVSTR